MDSCACCGVVSAKLLPYADPAKLRLEAETTSTPQYKNYRVFLCITCWQMCKAVESVHFVSAQVLYLNQNIQLTARKNHLMRGDDAFPR